MKTEPPILVRLWLCISAPKRWAKRRKIDNAGILLSNSPASAEEEELGYRLHVLSDRLWDEEFSRYYGTPEFPARPCTENSYPELMPTVTYLKRLFQAQIAPGDPDEFLRILTEADMRLLLYGRWSFTKGRDTLIPVDGYITLPVDFASILGARVAKEAVDIRDQDFEFVPGGRGEVELGVGTSRLIDQGMVDIDGPDSVHLLTISGTLTDGSSPVVFPSLPLCTDAGGAEAYSSNGSIDNPLSGVWYYVPAKAVGMVTFELLKYNGASLVASWDSSDDVDSVLDVVNWSPVSPCTGTPRVALLATNTLSCRRYKVTGYLAADDVVTALMHYAPVTLMDPDIADSSTPEDATVNTRCPDATALKLMMLGILMEEAHDHGGARSFISDALKSLDNKEQSYRGNAAQTITVRPTGLGIRRIRGWR